MYETQDFAFCYIPSDADIAGPEITLWELLAYTYLKHNFSTVLITCIVNYLFVIPSFT